MKILLATDGSPCSSVAINEVAKRPWPDDSQVRIIHVVEPAAPLSGEPYSAAPYFEGVDKAARDQAQDAIDTAAAILSEAHCNLAVSTEILMGSPKRVIVDEAEKWRADLIVVGSHGYRTWERMLLGSVSHLVALHAECSVEIVRKRV